jgi:hypothetical protein
LVYANSGDLENSENEKQCNEFLELWLRLRELQEKNLDKAFTEEFEPVPLEDVVEAFTKELKRVIKPYEELEKKKQQNKK